MPSIQADWHAIQRDLDAAPHGEKGAVLAAHAERLGVAPITVRRNMDAALNTTAISERPGSGRKASIPDALIQEVADLKARSRLLGLGERELSTENCIRILIDEGAAGAAEHLVTASGALAVSSVNRRLREAGYRKPQPHRIIEADFAGQEHQLDWSRSKYFQIDRFDPNARGGEGDFLLRVSGRELHYKDDSARLRTWLIQVKDSYSRLRLTRMVTVAGESALVAISFLDWCWRRDPDAHPMRHAPYVLKLDNGSTARRKEFRQMCEALGIELKTSAPYNSQSQGKVEAGWRSIWQRFELPLATRLGDGGLISLSEYNARLHDHLAGADADLRHPRLRSTRRVSYERSLLAHPPREVETDALALACYAEERKVSRGRVVKLGGAQWLAPDDVVDERIVVHRNARGELVAECLERARKPFALTPFYPDQLGDFGRTADVPQTRALKRAAEQIRQPIGDAAREVAPLAPEAPSNVVRMAPKAKTVQPSGPFADSTAQASLTEAEARAHVNRRLRQRRETWADYDAVFTPMLEGGDLTVGMLDAVLDEITTPRKHAV